MKVAIDMSVHAVSIIRKAYKTESKFFNGKATRSIIGGLLYLVGFRFYSNANQKKIAYVLNTSDTSIRKSYREWLNAFPNMFSDVKDGLETRHCGPKLKGFID